MVMMQNKVRILAMNRTVIIFVALFAGQVGAHPPEGQEMDAFDVASTLMSKGVSGDCRQSFLASRIIIRTRTIFYESRFE